MAVFSDYNPVLKTIYADKVSDVTFKDNPLLALLPKDKDFGGDSVKVPIRIGQPQGISATFSVAQNRAAAGGSSQRAFAVTSKNLYGIAQIPTVAVKASVNNKQAFTRLMEYEIDGILAATAHVLNTQLYRNGYGSIGVVASVSLTTITLTNKEDANNFEVGMELAVATDESSAGTRPNGSSGNGIVVTGVNASDGILTFAANVTDATNGIPGTTTGDVLFMRGNRDTASTPSKLITEGLNSWLPSSAPGGSDSFYGVNRSGNSRLYGLAYNGLDKPLTKCLVESDMQVMQAGGKLSHFFMNPRTWTDLAQEMEGKVQYTKGSEIVSPKVSFRTISILGMNGNEIKLVADRSCPFSKIYGLELDSFKLHSMGEPVSPINLDNQEVLRTPTADSIEFRAGFYGNLSCNAPGHNIIISK